MSTTPLIVPGFEPLDATPRPRLVIAVDALQKRGKTRFALTAPKPMGYINLDRSFESSDEDVQKLADGVQICDLSGASQRVTAGKGKLGDDALKPFKDAAEEILAEIVKNVRMGCKHFRSVAIDTATRWWEIQRIARFGKIQQVSKEHYGPVKAEFERYLYEALGSSANLILLHRQRAEYIGDNKTGRFERAGYSDVQYITHASVEMTRLPFEEREGEDLGFRARISDCGTNPRADGVELANEQITFQMVALEIRPDTTPDMWE